MAKVPVYNLRREAVGEIEISDDIFKREVNEGLLYDVVKAQLASKRSGSAKTKGRAEINGTSKKMYKQKGTGSGRHGNRKAPSFRGGGQAHGPVPRSYAYRPTRKMRLGALKSALSLKMQEGKLIIVDSFALDEVKTKKLMSVLTALKVDGGSLIVDALGNEGLRLSTRNLEDHNFLPPEGLNTYDLLRHPHLVVTKEAVAALEARCKD